jgi:hypothetical protein
MRTTVDLPADLHAQVMAIARDTHRTLSETVASLMRRGLREGRPAGLTQSVVTGRPTRLGDQPEEPAIELAPPAMVPPILVAPHLACSYLLRLGCHR